ncbi:MAG: hypothetical protein ACXVB9_17090 [Bdellovibrionota bacterium]
MKIAETETLEKIFTCIRLIRPGIEVSTPDLDLIRDLNFASIELVELSFELEAAFEKKLDFQEIMLKPKAAGGKPAKPQNSLKISEIFAALQRQ